MFPATVDHRVLSTLPSVDDGDRRRVASVLESLLERRVLGWISQREAAEPVRIARVAERTRFVRMDDELARMRLVSLASAERGGWTISIHERVFDYLAFGIPDLEDTRLASGSAEARMVVALAEAILRFEVDRLLVPERELEDGVVVSARYLLRRGEEEPEFLATVREALADPTNGVDGTGCLELLDRLESGGDGRGLAASLVDEQIALLLDAPVALVRGVAATLTPEGRMRLLDAAFRRSRDGEQPVRSRAAAVGQILAILDDERRHGADRLSRVLDGCVAAWGWEPLLLELGLDEVPENRDQRLRVVGARLASLHRGEGPGEPETSPRPSRERFERSSQRPKRTLEDRIEEARTDPRVPDSVIGAIDRNESNLTGHSKHKYAEFIETLLAVPWGTIVPIEVGPREFAAGLDASHYGLERPKEVVSDFFTNLIWRYREFEPALASEWRRTGSAFLFVGPPGVGKTSLAVSIATNLGIPFHKVSLGGMRDESDLRGHGFTYEGSKPGAIVQGLVKMGAMNGMFILDEADKTESFAIATLLEILDPEQNHLFHDRYTQTTVDIDLSNCHFILTANTLDTVPAPVLDRCHVVRLDRYALDEKVAIARRHILPRLRRQFRIPEELVSFEDGREEDLLRFVIRGWTHEAGVRRLEQVLRTLFLRVHRREILEGAAERVVVSRGVVKGTLDEPIRPRQLNDEDRIGEVLALGVDAERGVGSVIPIQATRIAGAADVDSTAVSMVHATGNIEKVMDESRRVATTGILHCAAELGVDPAAVRRPVHLHLMGGSSRKDGPSAGAAIALALASLLGDRLIRRDVAITGEVDTQGRVTAVGGLDVKIETAIDAGCTTVVVPRENLTGPGGIASFPEALRRELQVLDYRDWSGEHEPFDPGRHVLQVVGVGHLVEARDVAFLETSVVRAVEERFVEHARGVARRGRFAADAAGRCPMTVWVKSLDDVDEALGDERVCSRCGGCRLAVPPGSVGELVRRHPHLGASEVVEVDPVAEGLAEVLARGLPEQDAAAAVVAPYFALREAIDAGRLDPAGGTPLVATNWAVQGVKVKACKGLVHRLWCRLLRVGLEHAESAPFLARRDGIWMLDLAPIPEKYRLDVRRAERILARGLEGWLEVVEEGLASAGAR